MTCLQMFYSFLEHLNTHFEAKNECRSSVVKMVKWLYIVKNTLYAPFQIEFMLQNDECIFKSILKEFK